MKLDMKLFWTFPREIITKKNLQTEISSFDREQTILEENFTCNPKSVHELVGRAAAAQ